MEKIGRFIYAPLDEAAARAIAGWRYAPPYDLYNVDPDDVEETVQWFVDPHNHYFAVRNDLDELIGFRCFGHDARVPGGDYSGDALDLGGGLTPQLTGQGLGGSFMKSAFEFARRHYGPRPLRTTVAAFNQRALRVCRKVGYRPVQTFAATHTGMTFVMLVRD